MHPNSDQFKAFLLNRAPTNQVEQQRQQPSSKLKLRQPARKTQLDLGEEVQKKVKIEQPNLLEKIHMNPIDLVKQSQKYQFGNYQRYYSLRLRQKWDDPRLHVLNEVYFRGKNVLDIGCNDGTLTLLIGMRYFPKLIRGIDIDHELINHAIDNMLELDKQHKKISKREYNPMQQQQQQEPQQEQIQQVQVQDKKFSDLEAKIKSLPKSFLKQIDSHKLEEIVIKEIVTKEQEYNEIFPQNVYFRVQNIIGIWRDKETYDTILCLSLTKWIHLNFGDAGIHKLFKQIVELLNVGGHLILEPQDWKQYKKKKYFSPEFKETYQSIQFKPADFPASLVNRYQLKLIDTIKPDDENAIRQAKNTFKRTIYIFQKV